MLGHSILSERPIKYSGKTIFFFRSQLRPPEDVQLRRMLSRPGSAFIDDLSTANEFRNEGYESIKRVCVVCDEDICVSKEFQDGMIHNNPANEAMEMKGVDHMPMLSKPHTAF